MTHPSVRSGSVRTRLSAQSLRARFSISIFLHGKPMTKVMPIGDVRRLFYDEGYTEKPGPDIKTMSCIMWDLRVHGLRAATRLSLGRGSFKTVAKDMGALTHRTSNRRFCILC